MGKLFGLDSPFVQFMNRVADLMLLNILFLVCCIPVITIGDAITAMFYVTLKMTRNEESYIIKSFFRSFKQNFLQATGIWLIFVLAGSVWVVDYYIVSGRIGVSLNSGTMINVLQVLLIGVLVFYLFTFTFVFPVLSKFDNTVKNTLKNAFLMSIRHFPVTLSCIAIWIIVALLIVYIPIIRMLSIFLLFSLGAFCCSFMFVKVFDRYIPQEEPADDIEEGNTETAAK
ncbi:MAG: DUF624 domain-containing protein [Lachnospiraceae bacterium]|nr:DUF624 domain-containing protein [Lachnospiraceae bacterium]